MFGVFCSNPNLSCSNPDPDPDTDPNTYLESRVSFFKMFCIILKLINHSLTNWFSIRYDLTCGVQTGPAGFIQNATFCCSTYSTVRWRHLLATRVQRLQRRQRPDARPHPPAGTHGGGGLGFNVSSTVKSIVTPTI